MSWPFGKTKKIKCSDGTCREVYKNLDDVFPLYTRDWSRRFEATAKALKELEGSLGINLRSHIGGLFVQLSDTNESMQFKFRAAYSTYATNPCELDGWLAGRIQQIIEQEDTLKRMNAEINKIRSLGTQGVGEQVLGQAIAEALTRLSKSEIEEEISNEFKKVEENTSAWEERIQ